jgi:hypothetical protein
MGKFKYKLQKFFYGRYGGDTLNNVLLGVYVFLVLAYYIISLFLPLEATGARTILSLAYYLLTLPTIIVIFFRMFSRNIVKRRRENDRFCGFFRLRRNKFRDRKTHVYRKCPQCRAVLRLPRAKGKHTVVCPRCKHRFEVKG